VTVGLDHDGHGRAASRFGGTLARANVGEGDDRGDDGHDE
jgi:hypothetical protein